MSVKVKPCLGVNMLEHTQTELNNKHEIAAVSDEKSLTQLTPPVTPDLLPDMVSLKAQSMFSPERFVNSIQDIISQYDIAHRSTKKLEADFDSFRSQITAKYEDLQGQLKGNFPVHFFESKMRIHEYAKFKSIFILNMKMLYEQNIKVK